jgi:hypothetical protein
LSSRQIEDETKKKLREHVRTSQTTTKNEMALLNPNGPIDKLGSAQLALVGEGTLRFLALGLKLDIEKMF